MPQITGTLIPPQLSAAPASPAQGQLYYDTTTSTLFYWNGSAWVAASSLGGGVPPTRTVYLSGSGTYTPPPGCKAILVECVGGGGSGGSVAGVASASGVGGAGAGGSYANKLIASPAASYAYVVGAGGAAPAAGANNGNAGGDTTFGATLVVAKGGGGGNGITASTIYEGAAGGVAQAGSVGDVTIAGSDGTTGISLSATAQVPSLGGAAASGGGSTRPGNSLSTGGGAGKAPGGGGTGAAANSATSQPGGAGAGGIIVITEFYSTTPTIPACRVRSSADLACANAATTALAFSVEDYDNAGMHDPVTNNNRVTIARAGLYRVDFTAIFTATVVGNSYLRLRRNGAVEADHSPIFATGNLQTRVACGCIMKCAAGDYIDVGYFNNTGGSVTVTFSAPSSAALMVAYLGTDQ